MSIEEFDNIAFDLPKNQSNVIKVIGVGGGGSNAINHMFQQGIKGVDFVICNTDAQALENSPIPTKIQLGVNLTEGLGAGANPDIGEQAAIESNQEIKELLDKNTKMVFITAGMGGGTGTGAAPIIAKQAREMDILTVGIVTIPFQFEGKTRNKQAQIGVEKLRENVDSLIVINNNKLREVYGNLGFKAGFSKADEVLATASRGIAEVITHHYTQNIDLRDAKTVLSNSGTAIMGSASASGTNRSQVAIEKALDSPLLNDNKITGAQNVLLLIVSGKDEITIDEIGEINDHIQNEAGNSANIIMGVGEDENLDDAISVTVIATGFNVEQQNEITNTEVKKIIHTLEEDQKAQLNLSSTVKHQFENPIKVETTIKNKNQKIIHTLNTNNLEKNHPNQEIIDKEDELIATTNYIKNIEVKAEHISMEDIEIIDKSKSEENQKEQHLTFDLFSTEINKKSEPNPTTIANLKEEEDKIFFELEEEFKSEENIPSQEINTNLTKEKKYQNQELKEVKKDNDDFNCSTENTNLQITTKIEPLEEQPNITDNNTPEDVDPINTSIAELKLRAAERRAKMKQFNYKFSTSTNIDEIEKQPAYKRAGIELEDPKKNSKKISRTSLYEDGKEINMRSNNSFLHDNVD